MDKKVEILVNIDGDFYTLDLYDNVNISLNYSVNDVQDISSRNGAFSKTIVIPATNNNNYILKDLSNIFVDTSLDINKKIKCLILVDEIPIIDGFMTIKNFNKKLDNNYDEYEIVIYDEKVDFYGELKKIKLTDIDFSELNHIWNHNNIVNSWTASWYNGYYYPLIDYGYDWDISDINGWDSSSNVYTYNMFPSTNVKYIIDKIFDKIGYKYESDFFNSKFFKSLYIPFNKEEFKRKKGVDEHIFYVGLLNNYSEGNTNAIYDYNSLYLQNNSLYYLELYNDRIKYNNENPPYGDNNNLYSTVLFEYTAPPFPVSCRFIVNFDIEFKYRADFYEYYSVSYPYNEISNFITIKRSKNPFTGVDYPGGWIIPTLYTNDVVRFVPEDIPNIEYTNNFRRVRGQVATIKLGENGSLGNSLKLFPGEKVWVEIKYSCNSQYLIDEGVLIYDNVANMYYLPPTSDLITFHEKNEFFIEINDIYVPNEIINYNDVIPEDVFVSDFFKSLCNMFNLYIEESKKYNKCLIIEPREEFYKKGNIQDWTFKLSTDNDFNVDILPDFANKKYIFKYKNDEDVLNKIYTENTNNITYGEENILINNEHLTGEKKVEIIFSPTPLTNIKNSYIIIPKIGKIDNDKFSKTKHNIRILQRFNSSTENKWHYDDFIFYNNPGDIYNGYVALTTDIAYNPSFTNLTHSYSVGDFIKINQDDGGITKPMLEYMFEVVKVVDDKTIVINITFDEVGSAPVIGGWTTPLDGLLPIKNNGYWSFNAVRLKAYPYLGHFDNPYKPKNDINFGITKYLFYKIDDYTDNNLYNKYWSKYIYDITSKNSRLVRCKVKLNERDINELSFKNLIFIDGCYYYLNKIIDYTPIENNLTVIELLKVNNFTIEKYSNDDISLPDIILPNNPNDGRSSMIFRNNFILGRFNDIKRGVVVGDNNFSNRFNIIIGNNNNIKGSDNLIIGDDIDINLQNSLYINKKLINSANYISAGFNEILNPFGVKIINYISAGFNVIRDIGSYDNINYIYIRKKI